MFGFGRKNGKETKSRKSEQRYVDRKDDDAGWGFLESAKEESDRNAKRGGR